MLLSAADDGAGCKAGGSVAALACQADTWLGQLTGARQTSCTGRQTGRLAGRQAQGLAGPVCSLQPVLAWKPKVAMLFCSSSFTARAMSSLAAQQGGGQAGQTGEHRQAASTGRQRGPQPAEIQQQRRRGRPCTQLCMHPPVKTLSRGMLGSRGGNQHLTNQTASAAAAPTCENVVEGHAGHGGPHLVKDVAGDLAAAVSQLVEGCRQGSNAAETGDKRDRQSNELHGGWPASLVSLPV